MLAIGNSFPQNATYAFKPDLYAGKTLIHVNIDPHELNKVYRAEVALLSDAKAAIAGITENLARREIKVEPVRIEKRKFYDLPVTQTGSRIHPAELVRDHLPEPARERHYLGGCRIEHALDELLPQPDWKPALPESRQLRPHGQPCQCRHWHQGRQS